MPIDAAEFDAHRDLATIITQFLCRNRDKGFSAKEIAQATGIPESDVNSTMLKLGFSDIANMISGKKSNSRVQDVTVGETIYYRCVSD
jgi:hypothetical protein